LGGTAGGARVAAVGAAAHPCGLLRLLARPNYLLLLGAVGLAVLPAEAATDGRASGAGPRKLFVSTKGSDEGRCTRAQPCASFNRAYRAASAGQVVEVAAGSYPPQQIVADPSKTSAADVVFRPAPRAAVFVSRINLGAWNPPGPRGASHVTFKNMSTKLVTAYDAVDITWENLDARSFYLASAQHVRIKGGDYGPCTSSVDNLYTVCQNSKIDLTPAGKRENRNITIDGAVFHDYRIGRAGDHWECLIIFSGRGIQIRNSRFVNCEYFDILLEDHRADPLDRPLRDVVLENNWFDTPWDGAGGHNRPTAVAFSLAEAGIENVLVRSNSFHENTGLVENTGGGTNFVDFRVVANLLGRSGCAPRVAYSRNVRAGTHCSPSDKAVPWGYARRSDRLRPTPAAAKVVRTIFREAARGVGPSLIARRLRAAGSPTPPGREWTAAAVRAIARDAAYRGGRYGARGAHPGLVALATWRAAQARLG
jgi:Recombinase